MINSNHHQQSTIFNLSFDLFIIIFDKYYQYEIDNRYLLVFLIFAYHIILVF
jgi:hypothetical protein